MNAALVLCEGAKAPRGGGGRGVERVELHHDGPAANLTIRIENLTGALLRDLRPRARDLIRIAAYVYGADTSLRRGTPKDVYADDWCRDLRFVIPVADPDFWGASKVCAGLRNALEFLTGDRLHFSFIKGKPLEGQLHLELGHGAAPQGNVVTLFSGGMDSLAAVLEQLRDGLKPVLVSHRSVAVIDARQKNLALRLRQRFPAWQFPHVSVWGHRSGDRAAENSQRSRSFLYLALAAAVAAEQGIHEIHHCDNGVTSLNLPKAAQVVSTMATRSTNPVFHDRFASLMETVFGSRIVLRNTLLTLTRSEVASLIANLGHPDLIQETVSCGRTEGMTNAQPHCGVCSQCVDRRFATIAAGLEAHDLEGRYERDIFTANLREGDERAYSETYIRSAFRFEGLSDNDYLASFPELQDCVLALKEPPDSAARALIDVHRRHARAVLRVAKEKARALFDDYLNGKLSDSCLTSMLLKREYARDPKSAYVRRLASLLARNIPKAFQSTSAINEINVQDAGNAVLGAAQESLRREVPMLPFGAVTTKPDFSEPSVRDPLFVEFKFVKARDSLRSATTEMTSRIVVYGDQGASILFVVYDPKRVIADDDELRLAFEKHPNVWLVTVR